MKLKWTISVADVGASGAKFRELDLPCDNIDAYEEKRIWANFGLFRLSAHPGRHYKDGTRQWVMFLYTEHGVSKEIIPLVRCRGRLSDIIQATEELLGRFDWTAFS